MRHFSGENPPPPVKSEEIRKSGGVLYIYRLPEEGNIICCDCGTKLAWMSPLMFGTKLTVAGLVIHVN